MVQQKSTEELELRSGLFTGPRGGFTAHLERPLGEVKPGCRQREWQDLRHMHMPLPGLQAEGFGFWAKARLVNSKQKEWGFSKF